MVEEGAEVWSIGLEYSRPERDREDLESKRG